MYRYTVEVELENGDIVTVDAEPHWVNKEPSVGIFNDYIEEILFYKEGTDEELDYDFISEKEYQRIEKYLETVEDDELWCY